MLLRSFWWLLDASPSPGPERPTGLRGDQLQHAWHHPHSRQIWPDIPEYLRVPLYVQHGGAGGGGLAVTDGTAFTANYIAVYPDRRRVQFQPDQS